MMPVSRTRPPLSERELRILRAHWEWSSRYIVFSLVACFAILGGALAMFEMAGIEDRARTPALILLATMILINVIWRAAAALAGRIELMLLEHRLGGSDAGRD